MTGHATIIFVVCTAVVCFGTSLVSDDWKEVRQSVGCCLMIAALLYIVCSLVGNW